MEVLTEGTSKFRGLASMCNSNQEKGCRKRDSNLDHWTGTCSSLKLSEFKTNE